VGGCEATGKHQRFILSTLGARDGESEDRRRVLTVFHLAKCAKPPTGGGGGRVRL